MGGIIAAILVLARAPRREARDGRKIWQFCLDLWASALASSQKHARYLPRRGLFITMRAYCAAST